MPDRPVFRVISPDASPEELAAITAAIEVVRHERAHAAARAAASATGGDADQLDAWVRASRLSARRAGLLRGPWRLSGRIGRRARA
jgi:alkylhydroperoxidase family enzyme